MRKNNFVVISLITIIIIIGLIVAFEKIDKSFFKQETQSLQESSQQEVILIIDKGEEVPPLESKAEFKEGMTAFSLLRDEAVELNLILKTKTYDIGIFIEAIGDKENGQDGKYWLYYINGEMPQVSADKKELKIGDKVEFKFEKSPF